MMLQYTDDTLCRTYNLFDFGNTDEVEEKVIFEAVGGDLEFGMIDYGGFDTMSVISSSCSSNGTPSCPSSPCSSDRDYCMHASSFAESLFDVDETNFDFDVDFHSCSNSSTRSRRQNQRQSKNDIQRRGNCSSKRRLERRNELELLLTCSDCRWSELSTHKQQEVLELLIGLVSQKLGLREQLELIRMISPDADVSPNDKEFFIDFDLFDDEKFKEVCSFVKHHLFMMKDEEKPISHSERYSKRNSKRRRVVTKQRPLKSKVLAKTSKQIKKEKRSGLFKQEQILFIKEDQSSLLEEEELDVVS